MGVIVANGARLRIPLKPRHVIGRTKGCDLRLLYREVSSEHAELRWNQDHWEIRDAGSSNGTLINQQRIPDDEWMPLSEGDRVAFGHYEIAYRLVDAGPPEGE